MNHLRDFSDVAIMFAYMLCKAFSCIIETIQMLHINVSLVLKPPWYVWNQGVKWGILHWVQLTKTIVTPFPCRTRWEGWTFSCLGGLGLKPHQVVMNACKFSFSIPMSVFYRLVYKISSIALFRGSLLFYLYFQSCPVELWLRANDSKY